MLETRNLQLEMGTFYRALLGGLGVAKPRQALAYPKDAASKSVEHGSTSCLGSYLLLALVDGHLAHLVKAGAVLKRAWEL